MPKYLIIEYQESGCDYTIGCGVRVNEIIEANDVEGAIYVYTKRYFDGESLDDYDSNPLRFDHAPDSLEIYEIMGEIPFDLEKMKTEWDEYYIKRQKRIDKQAEKKEYERLKAKYETED